MADQPDQAAALPEPVEDVHHLVEGLLVQRAEPLVHEQGLDPGPARLGLDHVGQPQRQSQRGEEGLAAGQRAGVAVLARPAVTGQQSEAGAGTALHRAVGVDEGVAALGHPQQPSAGDRGHLLQPGGEHEGRQRHAQRVAAPARAQVGQAADLCGLPLQGLERGGRGLQHRQQLPELGDPTRGCSLPRTGGGQHRVGVAQRRGRGVGVGRRVQRQVELGIGQGGLGRGPAVVVGPELPLGLLPPQRRPSGGSGSRRAPETGRQRGGQRRGGGPDSFGARPLGAATGLDGSVTGSSDGDDAAERGGQIGGTVELPGETGCVHGGALLRLGGARPLGGLLALEPDAGRLAFGLLSVDRVSLGQGRVEPAGVLGERLHGAVRLGAPGPQALDGLARLALLLQAQAVPGRGRLLRGDPRLQLGQLARRVLGEQPRTFLVVAGDALAAALVGVGVRRRTAHLAGCAVLEPAGQLGDHRHQAGLPQLALLLAQRHQRLPRQQALLVQPPQAALGVKQVLGVAEGGRQQQQPGLRLGQSGSRGPGPVDGLGGGGPTVGQQRQRGGEPGQPGGGVVRLRRGPDRQVLLGGQRRGHVTQRVQQAGPPSRGLGGRDQGGGGGIDSHPGRCEQGPGGRLPGRRGQVVGLARGGLVEHGSLLGRAGRGGELGFEAAMAGLESGHGLRGSQRRPPPRLQVGAPSLVLRRQPQPIALDRGGSRRRRRGGEVGLGLGEQPRPPARVQVAAAHVTAARVAATRRRVTDPGRLAQPGGQHVQLVPGRGHRCGGGDPPGHQPVLNGLEALRREQPLQQLPPLAAVGPQELRELPLRQQHHLEELVGAHAQQGVELGGGLVDAGRDRDPPTRAQLLEVDARLLGGRAGAAGLGPLLRRAARDPPAPAPEGHLQLDLGAHPGVGVVGPQPTGLAAHPRHPAVQREAQTVEQGGLPGSRRAVQQEQPAAGQRVEVDLDRTGERAEGLQPQAVRPHPEAAARRPASSACCSRARSASSAAPAGEVDPPARTCRTNSMATSRSSRSATRAP